MDFPVRLTALFALCFVMVLPLRGAADYEGPDGYGTTTTHEHDVAHDGYAQEAKTSETPDPTTYVVIEAEEGKSEQVDGETVIVVEEPEPIAATEHAPPPPQTVEVEHPVTTCPGGIWVDGYWYYSNGEYLWVDGHCVVERVNYVFVAPRWDYYANVWWFVPGYYCPWGVYVGFGYYRPWHWYPPYYGPYYRHPVPIRRGTPRRPTTVRARPAPRTPSRGVLTRPGYPRTTTAQRQPPATYGRTDTVGRVGATPDRGRTVTRAPTGTSTVTRSPATRSATVTRTSPSPTRVDAINRGRPTSPRSTVVYRPPPSTRPTATPGRAATVGRAGTGPTLTSSVPRSPSGSAVVSQPRVNRSRTGNVYRPPSRSSSARSVTRPGATSPSRTGSARPSSTGRPRGGSIGGRSSSSPSRSNSVRSPSFGGSRGGSFGRPSGGFGGSRSAPAPRGR
jgi:hypothetical protein